MKEWIGEYWLRVEEYQSYKDEWVEKYISLGKCLSWDEACEKAVIATLREFSDSRLRDVYILNGWGQLRYM